MTRGFTGKVTLGSSRWSYGRCQQAVVVLEIDSSSDRLTKGKSLSHVGQVIVEESGVNVTRMVQHCGQIWSTHDSWKKRIRERPEGKLQPLHLNSG